MNFEEFHKKYHPKLVGKDYIESLKYVWYVSKRECKDEIIKSLERYFYDYRNNADYETIVAVIEEL